MSNEQESGIRDLRNGGWYWINRHIIKKYGRLLGASGLAVYNVLASYANSNSQTCYPTQKSVADHLGISVRTVNRKIRLLRDFKLIKIKKKKGRCLYSLLKIDTPKGKRPYDKRDTRDRTPGKSNNNQLIKINNKINRTSDLNNFKPLNKLIKKYGKETFEDYRH